MPLVLKCFEFLLQYTQHNFIHRDSAYEMCMDRIHFISIHYNSSLGLIKNIIHTLVHKFPRGLDHLGPVCYVVLTESTHLSCKSGGGGGVGNNVSN